MMRETMPKHKIKTPRGVTHCFNTLCDVLGLSVVEMWSQGADSFGLVDFHVAQLPDEYVDIVASYHSGERENVTSRSLSKQALKAKGNYYWIAKQERRLHPEMKFHTAVSFRVPSDDTIGADVYIVAYSLKFNAFTESKMNFFALMSYGAVIAMHSSTLYSADSSHHMRVDEANNKTSSSSGDTHNIRIQLLRDTQLIRDPHAELTSAINSNVSSVSFSEFGSRLSKDDFPPNLTAVRMLQANVSGTDVRGGMSLFGPTAAAAAATATAPAATATSIAAAAAAAAATAATAAPAAAPPAAPVQQPPSALGRSSMVDRTLSNLLSALRMPSHDKRAAAAAAAASTAANAAAAATWATTATTTAAAASPSLAIPTRASAPFHAPVPARPSTAAAAAAAAAGGVAPSPGRAAAGAPTTIATVTTPLISSAAHVASVAVPSGAPSTSAVPHTLTAQAAVSPSPPASPSQAAAAATVATPIMPQSPVLDALGDQLPAPGLRELETYSVVSGGSSFQFLKPNK
jgi:hypothetical protein